MAGGVKKLTVPPQPVLDVIGTLDYHGNAPFDQMTGGRCCAKSTWKTRRTTKT